MSDHKMLRSEFTEKHSGVSWICKVTIQHLRHLFEPRSWQEFGATDDNPVALHMGHILLQVPERVNSKI